MRAKRVSRLGTGGRSGARPRSFLTALLLLLVPLAAAAVPEPTLFDAGWDDRGPYLGDLRDGFVAEALELRDAPVYHLSWRLAFGEDATALEARQETRVRNGDDETWNSIYFHLLPSLLGAELRVVELAVNGVPRAPVLEESGRLLRIDLTRPLEPGGEVVVALRYRLDIPLARGRNYGILGHREGRVSLAHAYAMLAVRDEDGWSLAEPAPYGDLVYARSAFFRVRIEAPSDLAVASSGSVVERQEGKGRQQLEIAAGPVRDFYLWAGRGFTPVERRAGEVLLRGWSDGSTSRAMNEALEHAADSLTFFEEWLSPYPFREFEVVPISTSALGVEFPGIIALRRQLLDGAADPAQLESTTVHEVAHQWFYSLVGNDQLRQPWLDESLTQYATLRYYLERRGSGDYLAFRDDLVSRWGAVERKRVPIGLAVADYTSMEYGAIVYGLGPLVLELLAETIGVAQFDRALQRYVEGEAFGIARPEEFEEALEGECSCELDAFFEEWVEP